MLRLIYLEGFHLWQAALIHCSPDLPASNVSSGDGCSICICMCGTSPTEMQSVKYDTTPLVIIQLQFLHIGRHCIAMSKVLLDLQSSIKAWQQPASATSYTAGRLAIGVATFIGRTYT